MVMVTQYFLVKIVPKHSLGQRRVVRMDTSKDLGSSMMLRSQGFEFLAEEEKSKGIWIPKNVSSSDANIAGSWLRELAAS